MKRPTVRSFQLLAVPSALTLIFSILIGEEVWRIRERIRPRANRIIVADRYYQIFGGNARHYIRARGRDVINNRHYQNSIRSIDLIALFIDAKISLSLSLSLHFDR